MNDYLKSSILHLTDSSSLEFGETIQELWSGYGKIQRVKLYNSSKKSIIIKHIKFPSNKTHSRGWNTEIGHQRKVKSYIVESNWYKEYSKFSKARLPNCYGVSSINDETIIILEDLSTDGFFSKTEHISWLVIEQTLKWLAQFHASFLNSNTIGLWNIGTYWHLKTRPEELNVLRDKKLKKYASEIDSILNNCKYKTIVHGDAKLANFCYTKNNEVAGLDYQYVGGGCGMKDVAYFISSCLNEDDCKSHESKILDIYFKHLQSALGNKNEELENEWRALYYFAWADFNRFLKGWSPNHWKNNSYINEVTETVIKTLE